MFHHVEFPHTNNHVNKHCWATVPYKGNITINRVEIFVGDSVMEENTALYGEALYGEPAHVKRVLIT